MFHLDEQLSQDTLEIVNLGLSYVGLMNDKRYPWLIVVPRKVDIVEITDLDLGDQHVLLDEVTLCSTILRSVVPDTHKVNIAALGNVVRQLHVHVVARKTIDAAWPGPVWGVGESQPYSRDESELLLARLRVKFAAAA